MFKSIRASKTSTATAVLIAVKEDLMRRKHDDVPARLRKAFALGVKQVGFKAKNGETILVGGSLLIVGGGDRSEASSASARKAGALFAGELERFSITSILMHPRDKTSAKDAAALSRAFAEGIALSQWRLKGFDGSAAKEQPKNPTLAIAAVR